MKHLHTWIKDESGASTLEFVLLFPVVFSVFLMSLETSIIIVRQAMLERAVDITSRSLRLSSRLDLTTETVADMICDKARIIRNCHETISLDLRSIVRPSYVLPSRDAMCIDRNTLLRPVTRFEPSQTLPNELMLLRVCVEIDPLLRVSALMAQINDDTSGRLFMEASTIFVSEPITEVAQQ